MSEKGRPPTRGELGESNQGSRKKKRIYSFAEVVGRRNRSRKEEEKKSLFYSCSQWRGHRSRLGKRDLNRLSKKKGPGVISLSLI